MSEARQIEPRAELEVPLLTPVITPALSEEHGAEQFHLAAEFSDYLTAQPDYGKALSERERYAITPIIAHSFILDKVGRMPPHLRKPRLVSEGMLHSVITKFNAKYTPGTPLNGQKRDERDWYLEEYMDQARYYDWHPEILGTQKLLEQAEGLGREDLADGAQRLLAAYGRSMEIARMSHLAVKRSTVQ